MMNWNKLVVKSLEYLLMSLVLIFIIGCHKDTEQEKVKKIIVNIRTATEEKDVKKIMNSLSKSYKDPQGYDYDTMKGILLGYFFRNQKIHVYLTNIEIPTGGIRYVLVRSIAEKGT
jgi:hypothetical protein